MKKLKIMALLEWVMILLFAHINKKKILIITSNEPFIDYTTSGFA